MALRPSVVIVLTQIVVFLAGLVTSQHSINQSRQLHQLKLVWPTRQMTTIKLNQHTPRWCKGTKTIQQKTNLLHCFWFQQYLFHFAFYGKGICNLTAAGMSNIGDCLKQQTTGLAASFHRPLYRLMSRISLRLK